MGCLGAPRISHVLSGLDLIFEERWYVCNANKRVQGTPRGVVGEVDVMGEGIKTIVR